MQVLVSAVERRLSRDRPVNLAFGDPVTILDVADEIERQLDRPVARKFVAPRPGDVRDSASDPALLRSLFPAVEPVSFSAGIASVLGWMTEVSPRT